MDAQKKQPTDRIKRILMQLRDEQLPTSAPPADMDVNFMPPEEDEEEDLLIDEDADEPAHVAGSF